MVHPLFSQSSWRQRQHIKRVSKRHSGCAGAINVVSGVTAAEWGFHLTRQASRRQRPLLKGAPRQWRGMYPAGGASINTKSPFTYMDFLYVFSYTYPRLRRTPLKRGLAVAARLYLPKNRLQASRRQRPLLKGVPRQWRGMYPAGGASTNIKSPLIIWTFCMCFIYIPPGFAVPIYSLTLFTLYHLTI